MKHKILIVSTPMRRIHFLIFATLFIIPMTIWAQLPTAQQVASQMRVGWNLGNTLECPLGETGWGGAVTTQALIDKVKASGYNTVRLPVAWFSHSDTTTSVIDPTWLARVKEVVDYCINANMYVIINAHWDMGWLENRVNSANQVLVNQRQNAYWTQIANYFKNYDERLLFAGANEPNVEDAAGMAILLTYYQTFVDAVRATGGNNSSRTLIIQGPSTDIEKTNNLMNTLPTDEIANRLMVEVHYYTPWQFCLLENDGTEAWEKMIYYWGNGYHSTTDTERNATWGEESYVDYNFGLMKTKYVDNGIPVIIGEFSVGKRNLSPPSDQALFLASRQYYYKYVVKSALSKGMIPFCWDRNMDMFNRTTLEVLDQELINSMMLGASEASEPDPDPVPVQEIVVFNFDGVTPSFSSWSDTFAGEANPLSGGVNTSANAGKYTHKSQWSEVSTPVSIDSREYTTYEVSFYTPSSTTGSVSVACYDASNKQLDWYSQPITTAGVWTKYTRKLNCTGIIAKVAVSFNIDKTPSTTPSENVVYVDNLIFKKSTTLTLYAENFSASWSPYASWSGAPSTKADSWFGGVNLQTTGDANINLEQWWGDAGHVLKIATTDAEVIFPNINVAGFDSLKFSADMKFDASASPIVDVKIGDGNWVRVATSAIPTWSSMTNQVYLLEDAAGNPISNVSTISIRLSHLSATTVYYDNVKILGKTHYEFTGATNSDPTLSSNWLGGLIPDSGGDLTISGGNLEINQNATYNVITVNPTAKLTLNNLKSLTVSNLLLKSDATGTATFVDNNSTSNTISATVQQYLTATNRNWYLSSPIASATNGNLNTGVGVVEYNEQTGAWTSVSGTLNPMKGYISTAGSAGTGTLSFTGNLNSGPKSIILSKKGGATYAGFNLIGNPYPSYLMWTESLATSANCETTMWYRTKSAGAYAFETYNASGDLGVPLSTSGYIPPMQAFWVRTSVDGSTLAVNNSMRSHGNGSTNFLKAPANKNAENQIVCLQVSNGVNKDETLIYFNTNANNGFDTYDSPKWFVNNVSIPEIFTTSGTEKLVINGMKTIPENVEIPLGFGTGTSNDFTLAVTERINLNSDMQIILKDNMLKSEIELSEGIAYNFSSGITTPSTGRFNLIFRAPGTTTGINKTNLLNAQVFVNANNQIVIVTPEGCNYAVYNSVGQKISADFTSTDHTIVSGQKAGMYVVTLSQNGQHYCSKVVIK